MTMTCLGRRNTHRHSGHRHQGSWTSAINTITIIIIIRPNHINLTKRQDDIVVADMDVDMVADMEVDKMADMVADMVGPRHFRPEAYHCC